MPVQSKLRSLLFLVFAWVCLHWSSNAIAQISDPAGVSGLVFWVDARDVNGNSSQPANGASVTAWVDKSGNGNNLTTAAGTVTYEATGFDATNPGLRFPLVARMAALSPFSGTYQNQMTVFFVNANVTLTNNFALTLNGTNTGTNITNGRFSFHTPWTNNNVYFDAGACCGTTRLQGPFPNALTETTLFTGLNDQPGNRQWLRIDGQAFSADATGHNANVSLGIHLGDLPGGHRYDGRFAEVVVYDRALSLSEVEDVECYLLNKWKPSVASHCSPKLDVAKTVAVWDPQNDGLYAVPGNDVIYTIRATHLAGQAIDADTLFFVDALPLEITFHNGDIDGAGPETFPVSFSESGSGLTFSYATDVGYSNSATKPSDISDCTYIPSAGYDANIRYLCLQPTGSFQPGSPPPYFEIKFRARIE